MMAHHKGAPSPHSKAAQDIQHQQRVADTVRLQLAQARQRLAAPFGTEAPAAAA